MADNDRYRYDQDRSRDRDPWERERGDYRYSRGRGDIYGRSGDYGHRDDEGFIARRGFGNERSGYGRSSDERGYDDRYGRGRERDFGDSAGYGMGGSSRDWRDVMGEERSRFGQGYGTGYDRSRERGYGGGSPYSSTDERSERGRYGSSDFGRGSRGDYGERGFFERAGDEVRSWFGDEDAERRRMRDTREGDDWAHQHHRGRGPKNYSRSDDRIREDVNDRLTDDPHLDASEVEVKVENREVTLSGTVNSRFEKRHAEDIAESVSGVTHVQNNLRVQMSTDTGHASAFGTGAGSTAGATARPAATSSANMVETSTGARRRSPSTSST